MNHLDKLQKIVDYWNTITLDSPDPMLIDLMKDHEDNSDENSFRLTIVKDNVIMFRRGTNYYDTLPEEPYEILAEALIDDICFAGFSLILELQQRGTLTSQPYKA